MAIKKNELPEITPHGKAALNFQITILLIDIIGVIAFFIFLGSSFAFGNFDNSFPFIFTGGFVLGAVALAIINILGLVLTIIAAVKANNGEDYRYPFSIRFVR